MQQCAPVKSLQQIFIGTPDTGKLVSAELIGKSPTRLACDANTQCHLGQGGTGVGRLTVAGATGEEEEEEEEEEDEGFAVLVVEEFLSVDGRQLTEQELKALSREANINTADAKPAEFVTALEAMLVRTNATDKAKHTVHQKVTSLLLTNMPTNNMSSAEIEAMKELKMDKDIIMLPADKGRATVVMNRVDYNEKAKSLLDDQHSYKSTPSSRAKSMIGQLAGTPEPTQTQQCDIARRMATDETNGHGIGPVLWITQNPQAYCSPSTDHCLERQPHLQSIPVDDPKI
ncbi:hypothetical protein SprV_0100144200 [Sparganum proliferum]